MRIKIFAFPLFFLSVVTAASYSSTATASSLRIGTTSLHQATMGTPYKFTFMAIDGVPPYHWQVTKMYPGPIPGLTSSADGRLSGTPTSTGNFLITIQVTDDAGDSDLKEYLLRIVPMDPNFPLLWENAGSPLNVVQNSAHQFNLNVSYPTISVGNTPQSSQFLVDGAYSSLMNTFPCVFPPSPQPPPICPPAYAVWTPGTLGSHTISAVIVDDFGEKWISPDLTVNVLPPPSNTYYVATTGNDNNPGTLAQPFRTLNKGVSVLTPGYTLLILPGTYAESLKNVIPGGTDAAHPVILRASDPSNRPILQPAAGTDEVLYLANPTSQLHDIIIDGLVLDGINTQTRASVAVIIGHHIQLMNMEIKNGYNSAVRIAPHGGLHVASDYNQLINLDIHGITAGDSSGSGVAIPSGLLIQGGHTLVQGCKIHDNDGYGIYFAEDVSGLNPIQANTVTKNQIYHNTTLGIYLRSGGGDLLSNNLIYGNHAGGLTVGSVPGPINGVRILNNTIDNNNDISAVRSQGSSYGIGLNFPQNMTIANNLITRQQGDGIYNFSSDASLQIKNNLFFGEHTKDFYRTLGVDIHDRTNKATVSGNVFGPDPLYADSNQFNFHLKGASLGVNAGISFSETPDDYDGVSRPQGSLYDIGAFEYTPTSDVTPPSVPTGVAVQAVDCSNVTVSWQASVDTGGSGVSFYRVYRDGSLIGQVPAPAVSFSDVTTVGQTVYGYSVAAVDGNGNASAASAAVGLTTPACGPGTDYYVATDGSDTADGSTSHPWKTITHAGSVAGPGDTVHVRTGTYIEYFVRLSRSGTAARRLRFTSDVRWGAVSLGSLAIDGDYVDIEGFDIQGTLALSAVPGVSTSGTSTRIVGNRIHQVLCGANGSVAGIYNFGTDSIITGNVIYNIGFPMNSSCQNANGIYAQTSNSKIQNNTIYQSNGAGITIMQGTINQTVSNNLIYKNNGPGLRTQVFVNETALTSNLKITNNLVAYNSGAGITEDGGPVSNNRYIDNLVFGNATGITLSQGSIQTGTVTADPQFVNYQPDGSGDYHLKTGSLAIDAGTSEGAPSTDLDGNSRPQGAGFDIGPYEFMGGTTPGSYYVATTGNDSNPGTQSQPWATLTHAATIAGPGDTVHVAPGHYLEDVKTDKSGTAAQRLRFISDTRWGAVIERATPDSMNDNDVWQNKGDYVDLVNFEIKGHAGTVTYGIHNLGSYVEIRGNHVHDVANDGILSGFFVPFLHNHDSLITGNVIHDIGASPNTTASGIRLCAPNDRVQNNIVYHNFATGIMIFDSNFYEQVANNLIYNNGGDGITMVNVVPNPPTYGVDILNNLIVFNGGAAVDNRNYTADDNSQFLSNLIFGNGSGIRGKPGSAQGTVTADPQFVNYQPDGSGDYHLAAGSPAIDSGTATGAPATDIEGASRPQGSGYDIGPYETQGGVILTLPMPDLSAVPAQLPVNARPTIPYPPNLATQFQWTFQLVGGTAVNAMTANPSIDLSSLSLEPGNYILTLQATRGTVVSAPAQKAVEMVLPAPLLNLPSTLPINADITLGIPAGIQFARFDWSITSASPGSGSPAPSYATIARAGSAAFSTQVPTANAAAQDISLGYYSIRVTGYDARGHASLPAQGNVSFVSSDLSNVRVRPSPWRSNLHNGQDLFFDNLPADSTVKIFSVDGRWVKTLSNVSGNVPWNLKNDNGGDVASGIYLYLVTSPEGKAKGKFVIIR